MKKNILVCFSLMLMFQSVLVGCDEAHSLFKTIPLGKAQRVLKTPLLKLNDSLFFSSSERPGDIYCVDTLLGK